MEKSRKPKKMYYVLLNGSFYAKTYAVSAKAAIRNVWWKYEKCADPYKVARVTIDDFDAVEELNN